LTAVFPLSAARAAVRRAATRGRLVQIGRGLLLAILVLALAPAGLPPLFPASASPAQIGMYRGLGAWIDIYDDAYWNDPAAAVAGLAARGVRNLYLETCNYGCPGPIHRPDKVGAFIDAAHAEGMRIVAWYLPGFMNLERDRNRSLKAIEFESQTGQRFDSFALDIEARIVEPESLRNQRLLNLSGDIREAVGPDWPLGAIIPPAWNVWSPFPYRTLADRYDVFLPMAYFSGFATGPMAAHDAVVACIKAVRSGTDRRTIPIHVVGGIADGMGWRETRATVRAAREYGVLGASLYDADTSTTEDWNQLVRIPANPRQHPALPVSPGITAELGNIPDGDGSHPKEVWIRTGEIRGARRMRFDVFDAGPGEVTLFVNWHKVTDIGSGPAGEWRQRSILIPGGLLRNHRPNVVGFVADGAYPVWTVWGVRGIELIEA
jgi:hypothetical protein